MQSNEKSKRRNKLFFLLSLCAVFGIGWVVAATSITINAGSPLSLGAGYATATTCDTDVTISTDQAYDTAANIYKITALTITGVDISPTNTSTGIGCGATTSKIMQLAVITSAGVYNASWTLASISGASPQGDTRVYKFGAIGDGSVVSTTYYA